MTLPGPTSPDNEDSTVPVDLDGEGPFLLPLLSSEVSFSHGDTLAIMRMKTAAGQDVLLPFEKETLRAIGMALADTLKNAFHDGPRRRRGTLRWCRATSCSSRATAANERRATRSRVRQLPRSEARSSRS
ncbi:hypothetical protein JNW90_26115 [Micromonospora sp. STR1s_5]|nr:hypothetical protein [Micromonospora sp. STR1s_5]